MSRLEWRNAVRARINQQLTRPVHVMAQLLALEGLFYPLKGLLFFIDNYKPLLPIMLSVIIPQLFLHCYAYFVLFWALLPLNVAICSLSCGPLGVQFGICQTIQQCSWLTNYIYKTYFIKDKLNKIFDMTLCLKGYDRVVIPGKLKRSVPQTLGAQLLEVNPINLAMFLIQTTYSCIISFIPIVGSVSMFYNQAVFIGEQSQTRMMQLTRQRPRQIRYKVRQVEGTLFLFGVACQVLESAPIIGALFCFTDHVGAALLACEHSDALAAGQHNSEDAAAETRFPKT